MFGADVGITKGAMAKYYITAIRLSANGTSHEHIAIYWYSSVPTWSAADQNWTVSAAVPMVGNPNNQVIVKNPKTNREATVAVVRPSQGNAYLRSAPDDTRTDNLLSLPRK